MRRNIWFKTAVYTTTIAVAATLLIEVYANGWNSLHPDPISLYLFAALIASNLATWFLAILVIRQTAEIGAVLWAIFSPVLGLILFGFLSAPVTGGLYYWFYGAIAMACAFWITWPVSIACTVIVYRLVQAEKMLSYKRLLNNK